MILYLSQHVMLITGAALRAADEYLLAVDLSVRLSVLLARQVPATQHFLSCPQMRGRLPAAC